MNSGYDDPVTIAQLLTVSDIVTHPYKLVTGIKQLVHLEKSKSEMEIFLRSKTKSQEIFNEGQMLYRILRLFQELRH